MRIFATFVKNIVTLSIYRDSNVSFPPAITIIFDILPKRRSKSFKRIIIGPGRSKVQLSASS